jgi:hypothetical protein
VRIERHDHEGRPASVRALPGLGEDRPVPAVHAVEDADGDDGSLEGRRHLVEAAPQRWAARGRCPGA